MSLDWLLEPWASDIMRRALAQAVVAGLLCGALGCFVLVRGLAFLGEGTAHTIVLGVVLAALVGVPVGLGAVLVAGATVVLAQTVGDDPRFGPDAAMGVVMPSLFGAGVALAAVVPGYRSRLEDVLFGSVLGVTGTDLALAAGVALLAALVLGVAGKELVLVSFDRPAAAAMGYPVRALDLLLLGLVALAAVIGLRAVGNVLLAALLLGPPATARLVSRRFWPMAGLAAGLGAAAGLAGLLLTWHLEVGAGPAIVLVVVGAYLVAAAGARLRGVVSPA